MLINCKECGKEVSDTAKACPHCGAKVKKEKVNKDNINREPTQRYNPFEKIVETAMSSTKGKWIYLGTVIASCAIAVCFLIMTCLSFFAPRVFLEDGYFSDAYEMLLDNMGAGSSFKFTAASNSYIIRSNCSTGAGDDVTICIESISYADLNVRYTFRADGTVKASVIGSGIYGYYTIEGYDRILDSYSSSISAQTTFKYLNASLDLAEALFDYLLAFNYKSYKINSIFTEYEKYHDKILGLRISSSIIAAIFLAVSIYGVVLYTQQLKKKQVVESLQDDASDQE